MTATLTREARFAAVDASISAEAAIPCVIATTTPVMRSGYEEVLDCSASGVDLARAPLPLLVQHDARTLPIGVVENLRATGDRVTGMARFGTSPLAQQVRADVIAGVGRSLSVGYHHVGEPKVVGFRSIFRWVALEVSIVSVPADPSAGFYRNFSGDPMSPQTATKTNPNPDAEQIRQLCSRHGLVTFGDELLQRAATVDQARAMILDELARRDQASGGHHNVNSALHSGMPAGGGERGEERRMIEDTIVARMGGKPNGEIYRSIDMTGLAIRALELGGRRVDHRSSRDSIIRSAMHTTSDFPALLGSAVGRVLHEFYTQQPAALMRVSSLANLPDFRARNVIRLGNAPSLEKVNEHGEFTYGTVADVANAWQLATYGRIIALTRQALVNDDLGGFSTLIRQFAEAAAQREADDLTAKLLTPNQVDGVNLFDATRATLITDALDLTGLAAAVTALRSQREFGQLITQEPGFLVVPAALEMGARQLVASFVPNQSTAVQPYQLEVVVEPRLDASSLTAWYLVARNQRALEHGYLDGAVGPQVFQEDGFEIDGMAVKCRLDFGCGWVAPVGWVKSSGTT